MSDDISLVIDNLELANFVDYSIGGDLFHPADTWTATVTPPGWKVNGGAPARLYVNGRLEMTGILGNPQKGYDKRQGTYFRLQGRDLMGLVVDTHCEEFRSIQNVTIKALAEYLLFGKRLDRTSSWPGIPFLDRTGLVVPAKAVGGLKNQKKAKKDPVAAITGASTPHAISQIEPGMTVHQVLSQYAAARGLLFWSSPEGVMIFGLPKARGEGETAYTFTNRRDGRGNNILRADLYDDIDGRYSRVTVVGQVQSRDEWGMDTKKGNVSRSVEDATFPFRKPLVLRSNNDAQTPAMQARAVMESLRAGGWRYEIIVRGHSQGGNNYRYNELCRVYDEELEVDGTYLVYGRVFENDRREGKRTRLQIGLPRGA